MKTYTPEQLQQVVDLHGKWRRSEPDGIRADLTNAYLTDANLAGADLTGADLTDANLSGANLTGADLTDANLTDANLTNANLTDANLRGAYLTHNLMNANLRGANLTNANLRGANLGGANLTNANLTGANLSGANLRGAYLTDANLTDANLAGADLAGADLMGALGVASREECIARLDEIRTHVIDHDDLLDMSIWHGESWDPVLGCEHACQTAHCLAGWAQALCPVVAMRHLNPVQAGVMLIPLAVGRFWDSDESVLEWLRTREYARDAEAKA